MGLEGHAPPPPEGLISIRRGKAPAQPVPAPQPARRARALLCVTPFCSPNYPYPAPAYLARFLRRRDYGVDQADLSLEVMLRLFSRAGLERVFAAVDACGKPLSPASQRIVRLRARYLSTIDPVIRYLQGRDPGLAYRLCHAGFLPRGENFEFNKGFDWYDGAGNTIAVHDRAKFVGTLYLYDLAALIREAIFPYFQITLVDRFYDSFIHWCTTFDAMRAELERDENVVDEILREALDAHLTASQPDLVGVTVPFARNLYWALRIARRVKQWNPDARVVAGGGLFNTSMRRPSEPRLFDYLDYITLDDGEVPVLSILQQLSGERDTAQLKRTFYREGGAISYSDGCTETDAAHEDSGAPDYTGYRIADYLATLETVNINQRVRSDGWWNKLTMAHGCYWKKCSFCDIHLSYIGDYETAPARNLVDKAEEAIRQTGHAGFHFVDEAMPPKIMRDFAVEVLRRGLHLAWHGMLRFDKSFTRDQCRLLAAGGLVAVFGGLEVASDRLLALMKKGTTVEQVALVAKNFQEAGIRVHAYIMYGFPTQTAQETIDALDVVRQLFRHGLLTSASWAKFGVTPHSPIGRDPKEYGIEFLPVARDAFIEQIIPHHDPACDHERYTKGLHQALKFFGLGLHYDAPVEGWFDFEVPTVSIDRDLVGKALARRSAEPDLAPPRLDRRMLWLGGPPEVRWLPPEPGEAPRAQLLLHDGRDEEDGGPLLMAAQWAAWLLAMLDWAQPTTGGPIQLADIEASWSALVASQSTADADAARPAWAVPYQEMLCSPQWRALRERGLVLL